MASIIKVDTIQDQDGNNIINESANTITIGASGDAITIPSGATFASVGIDDNATSTAITIDSSENIGIGTASPSTKLHVVGDYGNTLLIGTSPKITVQHSGGTNQFVEIQQSGGASFIGTQNGTNDGELYILGRHTGNNQAIFRPNSIELYTANTERMRITSSGFVGIGTSSPNNKLDVRIASDRGVFFSGGESEPIYLQSYQGDASNNLREVGLKGSNILFRTGATTGTSSSERMFMDSNGQMTLLGSTTSFDTTGSRNGLQTYYETDSGVATVGSYSSGGSTALTFHTNQAGAASTEKMRILNNGNVGIGTSSPDATLHVDSQYTTAPSLTFGATSGQIFQNEDSELAIGLSSSSPYPLYMQGRTSLNSARNIVINPLGGNVGIGTSSPTLPLEVSGSGLFGGSVIATGSTTTTASRRAIMTHDGSSMKLLASGDSTHRNMIFYRDGGSDEAMRIDTSNRLMIGASNSLFNAQLTVNSGSSLRAQDGYNGNPPVRMYMGTDFTGGLFIEFTSSNGTRIGSITRASSTSIAFNTTSDYRLKENVVDLNNATTRLKQLKPKRFNFIGETDTTVDGFLAHEVSDIVPEAITGQKDEVREFGNIVDENNNIIHENVNENFEKEDGHTWVRTETRPVYQGIDQSKLVPLLTASLQEAIAKIEELETRLEALENI